MHKRIYGIEREYGLFPRPAYEFADMSLFFNLFLPRTREGAEITPPGSEFLANGGRARVDSGGHPEIATAECGSVRDCVVCDKAGERIFEDIALRFNTGTLPRRNGKIIDPNIQAEIARFGGLTFFKNNAGPSSLLSLSRDSWGWGQLARTPSSTYESWGSHLNMLLDKREVSKYDAAYILSPFCFSSAWLTGSGMVWVTSSGHLAYSMSQRLPFVHKLYNQGATDKDKPMFLLRDEALADPDKYYRLQCSGLDSSVCEWQTYVPLVIMGIIIRMAEDHAISTSDYCTTNNPFQFQVDLAEIKERTLRWGCEREPFSFRGETHTVASLHRKYYLEPILAFKASGVSWSDEEEDGVQKYEFLIKAFERARSSRELAKILAPYIGWAAKLHYLILPHMRQNGYSFGCSSELPIRIVAKRGGIIRTNAWERLKIFDNFFLDVRRDKSFYHTLAGHGLIRRIVSEEEIVRMKEYVPLGTRAEARDKRMAELRGRDDVVLTSLDWTYLNYHYMEGDKSAGTVTERDSDPLNPDPRCFKTSE